jgi:hypothetical protein
VLRKFVAICMVGAQLSLVTSLPAAHASERASNAELRLLETVITLKGLGLKEKELTQQLEAALEQYNRNAPTEGRSERLESALVGMGVFTLSQALRPRPSALRSSCFLA